MSIQVNIFIYIYIKTKFLLNFITKKFNFIEVVKDIIKNCSFETKKKDDLIIRQGDVGDW